MTQTDLRLTIFQVERLKNIVGLGNVSPYQISMFIGDLLGKTGTVIDPASQEAANDSFWLSESAPSTSLFPLFKTSLGLRHN